MHLRAGLSGLLTAMMLCGCASSGTEGVFHVMAEMPVRPGMPRLLADDVHDAAIRSGRAVGWSDAADRAEAAVKLAFIWTEDDGTIAGRVRLACIWSAKGGRAGHVADGAALPVQFWTQTRAAEAATRVTSALLRDLATLGPAGGP